MKKTIRLISFLLALILMFTSVACGDSTESTEATDATDATEETTAAVVGAYEGDEFNNGAVGENGCVSSYSEISSQIGVDILQAGGNAIDAAVATILAVGVIEPFHSGIGGSGFMTIYLAEENRYTTFEYLETIPAGGYEGYYNKAQYIKTARAAGVPGQIAGLAMALEKYGTMSWHDVLQPIIKLCREGFALDEVCCEEMSLYADYFAQPGYEELYTHFTDDGFPYSAGDWFTNEDLANTFETLANEGWQSFYTGSIAKQIAAGMADAGAIMDEADLAAYYATEREPITTNYYGYDIVTVPNPSVGGTLLIGALNIMQELDIAQYEQGSAEYWKVFNESCRYSNINAYAYSGDPAFYNMPKETLTSQEYAAERAELFSMDIALETVPKTELEYTKKDVATSEGVAIAVSPSINPAAQGAEVVAAGGATAATDITFDPSPGVAPSTEATTASEETTAAEDTLDTSESTAVDGSDNTLDESKDTTHICVIDSAGNIVSSTNTIGNSWGCFYMTPGLGFVYNNHLNNVSWTTSTSPDYFSDGGKKVRSTMSPTIVVKDGKPVMAVGSPGSTVIPPVIMSVINNVILYGYNVQEAINLPRAFTMDRSTEGPYTDLTAETGRLDKSLLRVLEVYGYTLRDGIKDYDSVMGGIAAIKIEDDGKIYGGGDPRRDYKAVAY